MKDLYILTDEEMQLIIAESLIEPRFEDPMREAEYIIWRIQKRIEYKESFNKLINEQL